jgi:hypothetical protein
MFGLAGAVSGGSNIPGISAERHATSPNAQPGPSTIYQTRAKPSLPSVSARGLKARYVG